MSQMISKDYCVQKYKEYKDNYGRTPKKEDFYEFARVHERALTKVFGRDAYTKLQKECGDKPNKLNMERTPIEKIMKQYGDLALKLRELPNSSDWIHNDLRPSISGLEKIHSIKWSEFPSKFKEWTELERISGYEQVADYIIDSTAKAKTKPEKRNDEFGKLISDIRAWSPARRRNSEGEYKIELRKHLESLRYRLNEEFGESNIDLLINSKYIIEIKKDPQLSEYDRLFGQLARHLQHQLRVVALIFDAPSEDKFSNFAFLVDAYLNKNEKTVELIKK